MVTGPIPPDSSTTSVLRRWAQALDARDWPGLAAVLTDDFHARFVHSGEEFDREGYVAFQADYPGAWRVLAEEVLDGGGGRGAVRARVTDGGAVFHVAAFATVRGEQVAEVLEVWADQLDAPPDAAHRAGHASAVGEATPDAHAHHGLDYTELVVDDLPAAQAFYARVFGWEFTPYGPEYAGFSHPGRAGEAGGLTTLPTGRRPGTEGPLVLLFSDDLDATARAVSAGGGRLTTTLDPFPGGRRFRFLDPAGNELGVWSTR